MIAALLLQLYTGRRPSKRMLELIQFYLLGYATLEELTNGLQHYLEQISREKELKSARGNFGRACPKAKLSRNGTLPKPSRN